jgi:RHS repeat-associated protein
MKRLLLFFLIFISGNWVFAQNTATLEINSTLTNTQSSARDLIKIKPGSVIKANSGGSSKVFINKAIELPVAMSITNFVNNNNGNLERDIDYTLAFGKTPSTYNINTSNGSLEYNVPLNVPIGNGNVFSGISLKYSSSSSEGICGKGWNISLPGGIVRENKNLYNDNKIEKLNFSDEDVFSFNGNRLYKSLDLGDYKEYKTENETFDQIISNKDWGSEYPMFSIKTKDELSINTTSFIPAEGSIPLYYPINRVSDNYGNVCEYIYNNIDGELLVTEIKYGNADVLNLPFSIKFYYDVKNNSTEKYINGFKTKNTRILREVAVFSFGMLYRNYKLNYTEDNEGNELLAEVIESNKNGESYNSLLFKYNSTNSNINVNTYDLYLLNSYCKQFTIDFNSDGLKDIISFNGTRVINGDGSSTINWQNWCVYKNSGNETNRFIKISTNTSFPANFEYKQNFQSELNSIGGFAISIFDINGDGFEDIFLRGINNAVSYNVLNSNNTSDQLLLGHTTNVYLSNGIDISATPTTYSSFLSQTQQLANGVNSAFFTGDFDGDKKTEILTYYAWHNGASKFFFTNSSNATFIDKSYRIDFSNAFVADFDGDGISDILNCFIDNNNASAAQVSSGVYALKFDSNRNFKIMHLNTGFALNKLFTPVSGCIGVDEIINLIGDYNGDGNLDNLITVSNPLYNYDWKGYINKGNSMGYITEISYNNVLGLKSPFSSQYRCRLVHASHDMNGDGLTDVLEFDNNNSNVTTLSVFYSRGNQFNFTKVDYTIPCRIDYDNNNVTFGDFNGDGVEDIYITNTLSNQPLIVYMNRTAITSLLTEVLDGTNLSTKFTYEKLTTTPNYSKTFQNTADILNYKGTTSVVTKVVFPDGVGGNTEINYSYKNFLIHKKGKGLLGFTDCIINNSTSLLRSEINIDFDLANSIYFLPKTSISKTYLNTTNTLLSTVTNTFELVSLNTLTKQLFYSLKKQSTIDHISNVSNETSYNYNSANGNLLSKDEKNVNTGYIKTNTFSNYIVVGTDNNLIPTVPTVTALTYSDGVNPNISSTSTLEYDLSKGSVKSKTEYAGTTGEVKHNYTYSSYGKLIEDRISPYNMPDIITKYDYDQNGLFIEKTTNAENEISNFVYNKYTGHLLTVEDKGGLISRYEYDSWGNHVASISPDNNRVVVNKGWITNGQIDGTHHLNTTQIISYKKVSGIGMPYYIEYYDAYGRIILTETEGLAGKNFSGKEYNAKGQLIKETNNYEIVNPQCSVVVKSYSYDDYNRLIETKTTDDIVSNLNELVTSYNYVNNVNGNLTTIITYPNQESTVKITNPLGLVLSSTDNGGTITYEYFADGKLKNTKLNNVLTNSVVYDDYGNQKELNEVNSGKTTYLYDALGNLIKQTDANLNVYDLIYDKIGRPKTKTGPEGVYTYTYVSSGKALGNLESIMGPNNTITSYVYDDLARVTKITEGTTTKNFVTQFTYNQYGKLLSKKYPGNFEVSYEYNTIGILNKIKQASNGATIWQANSMLPNGIINKYTYGNGLLNINTYDNYGNIKKQQAGTVFDLEYYINPSTGNMEWRKDNVAQLREDFTYDNLNRLETYIPSLNANYLQTTIAYKPNGNIESKTDAGNYTYHPTKINAVESVTNPVTNISLAQQDVTFNSFKKASVITEGNLVYNLTYGIKQQRIKSELKNNGTTQYTRYYASNFEQTINSAGLVTEVTYIEAPTGICAMLVNDNSNMQLYYVHADHLGSINTLTNSSGGIATFNGNLLKQSFDAWGRRRNITNWNYDNLNTLPNWLYRGYTGHEHLYEFSLINMNGRLYDPIVGRMLSPDKYAQAPDFSQSHNRYSYCLNNPLKYTDPSGNTWEQTVSKGISGVFTPFRMIDAPFSAASDRMNGVKNNNYFTWQYLNGNQAPYAASGGSSPGSSQYSATKLGGANNHLDPQYSNYDDMYDALNDGIEVPIFGYAGIGMTFKAQKRNGDWVRQYNVSLEERYVKGFYTLRVKKGETNMNRGKLFLPDNVKLNLVMDKRALIYNYIGPGPTIDPRYLLSLGLKPMNRLDYAAYLHDIAYYENKADGVPGALFNLDVANADAKLVYDSFDVIKNGNLAEGETRWAFAVAGIFSAISVHKAFAIGASENYTDNNFIK